MSLLCMTQRLSAQIGHQCMHMLAKPLIRHYLDGLYLYDHSTCSSFVKHIFIVTELDITASSASKIAV